MDKKGKIYIAGHRGLVGSAILKTVKASGYTNIVVKSSKELDLRDQVATEEFFKVEQPDYVFLCAAKVGGINANNIYRADFIYDNLAIQNSVIYSSYKYKVKKLLFLGSVCIYPKNAAIPITEDSLLTGELEYTNEPYALSKIAGIKLIESFNLQYGTNYMAVMPANLYGHNDNFDLEKSHVIPALIRKLILCKYIEDDDLAAAAKNLELSKSTESYVLEKLNKHGITKENGVVTLSVWGSGKPYREFLHADDMALACIYVMEKLNFTDLASDLKEVRNTHINLGTGSDITIKELVYTLKDIIGFGGEINFDTSKPDGTFRRPMSVEKINKLGWRHSIELKDGLKETVKWYLEREANS